MGVFGFILQPAPLPPKLSRKLRSQGEVEPAGRCGSERTPRCAAEVRATAQPLLRNFPGPAALPVCLSVCVSLSPCPRKATPGVPAPHLPSASPQALGNFGRALPGPTATPAQISGLGRRVLSPPPFPG